MNSTPETRARAQAVLDYIDAHPEQHDQTNWFISDHDGSMNDDVVNARQPGDCGTSMCIAGTAMYLEYGSDWKNQKGKNYSDTGRFLLGLNPREGIALFYEMDNDYAVAKLRKIAAGIEFDEQDFVIERDDDLT